MAGLLAWAADVVGGGGQSTEEADEIPLIFTPEQQSYFQELDRKAVALRRSIQDLRLRLPPPDISQRLPHLHAHSVASNAALALQLNAHSTTKEQVQLREVTLQEENAEYEKAISNCENKIREKLQETDLLGNKLKELDLIENDLLLELEHKQAAANVSQNGDSIELPIEHRHGIASQEDAEASKFRLLDKLEDKKKELASIEETVQDLERRWTMVQENVSKQPSSAQREKILDKQLHSLIEQLAAKQAQAEGLVGEVHMKELEFEKLNGLWRRLEAARADAQISRNRFGRSSSEKGHVNSDYIIDHHQKPSHHMVGRNENLQRRMLLRSAFVIYILALHILVFIKISF